jgi:DNA-directed RNA polymerase specialized sigma24 family protein
VIETLDVWAVAREACTPKQLEILQLHERHGMSYNAIAYAKGLSTSTVRGHLRSAQRNLARALERRSAM